MVLQLDTAKHYARNSKCTTVTNFSVIPQYFFRVNVMKNCSPLLKMAEMDSKLAQQEVGIAWKNRTELNHQVPFLDGWCPLMARAESKHKLD